MGQFFCFGKFGTFLLLTISFKHFIFAAESGVTPELILRNVSYGNDSEQTMDIYLPKGRNETASKVIMLIHGGGWRAGSKEHFNYIIPFLNASFPHYAIANINYRLGTVDSPGFPKQVEDVGMAIHHIKSNKAKYKILPKFGLMGSSAGGHLALLYGYGVDKSVDVNVICNIIGPTNLVDPFYTNNTLYQYGFFPLVGNFTYAQNPKIYQNASPIFHASKNSPKTISFYGGRDVIVPFTQGALLEDILDNIGVYNKYYSYDSAGHGNFTAQQSAHLGKKLQFFFKNYL